MKSLGDFPKVKILCKDIVARRRHIAAPSQGRLLLDERKSHGTSPNWTGSALQSLALRIDSRNGNFLISNRPEPSLFGNEALANKARLAFSVCGLYSFPNT
jgi:hypothetical protein